MRAANWMVQPLQDTWRKSELWEPETHTRHRCKLQVGMAPMQSRRNPASSFDKKGQPEGETDALMQRAAHGPVRLVLDLDIRGPRTLIT